MEHAENADFSLVIETLYQVAADPAGWDQLIDVLEADGLMASPPFAVAGAVDRAREIALMARAPGDGIGPQPAERSDIGWVLLSGARRVLALNSAATVALADGLGHAVAGKPIDFCDPANDEALCAAIARTRSMAGGRTILRLDRGPEEGPCFAYLAPADALAHAADFGVRACEIQDGALALVFPPSEATSRLWNSVRDSFGLTGAEVRLARKLRDGRSLKDAATELGVSVNTVRNQLAAVFDKMGLQRQSDLVRALTELSAIAQTVEAQPSRSMARKVIAEAPPIRRLRLSGGRMLAYRDYGDPGGHAVLGFHEGMGSSLPPPQADHRARALGLRMIIADRPGFGQSDPMADYGFDGVAADMVELLNHLQVERVRLLGLLSGAPSALLTAQRLGSRAEFVLLCSARPPRPARLRGENPLAQMRARFEAHPWVLASFYAILRVRLSTDLCQRLMRRGTAGSAGDRAFAEANPQWLAFMEAYVTECLAISSRGPVDEIKAFRRSGNHTTVGLTAPVAVWHGEEDTLAALPDLLEYLGDAAREVRVFPGAGLLMPMRNWDEVMARMAADPPR